MITIFYSLIPTKRKIDTHTTNRFVSFNNSTNQFMKAALITVFLFTGITVFSQVVGGRSNSESTPKVSEPAKISSGGFSGDVNLFSGGYGATIPLGSVSTPGGLSYNLSYNYNSSFTVGVTPPIATGIPYGEGWNLNIPTVSVETEAFNNFISADYCTEEGLSLQLMDFRTVDAKKEGDLYWYSPYIDIPGVASGRAIFKYIDVDDNQTAVFVLNSFESPVELRYKLGSWKVITADGTQYVFSTVMQSATAPANRRTLYYEQDDLSDTTNVANNVMMNGYQGNAENVANSISPKISYNLWYCTEISNRNIKEQNIVFVYEKFGAFNYFKEFKQTAYGTAAASNFQNTTFAADNDFTAYTDILLKRIESHAVNSMVQLLKLNYETNKTIINSNPELIPFYNPNNNGGRLDSLYSYRVVYQDGVVGDIADTWKRYEHTKQNATTKPSAVDGSNPYVIGGNYVRSNTTTDANGRVPFNHSFLETPRIATGNYDMIPGDIYEVRSTIRRSSPNSVELGASTIDIAVVTGNLNNPTGSPNITTTYSQLNNNNSNNTGIYYPTTDYNKTRGVPLFSTFNMALKWTFSYSEGIKQTSNFFVMPNVPSKFGGLNVQIGPGNSDINYASTPGTTPNIVASNVPNAQSAYVFKNNELAMKSAATVSNNFGIGLPWGMMIPIYKSMITVFDPLLGSGANPNDAFKMWWNSNPGLYSYDNRPTKMDSTVSLEEFQLIRYTKNPYMLVSIESYNVNGEINDPLNNGLKLVSKKKMEYTTTRTQMLENYDYNTNDPLRYKSNASTARQVHILLKAVREIPVIATSDTTKYLTTFLEYAPFVSADSVFNDTKPLNGYKGLLLSKFVDQLGGITKIEYYPVTDQRTYYTNRYVFDTYCNSIVTTKAFGTMKAVTAHPVVKYILKNDENDLVKNGTASSNNAHKRWMYDFDVSSKVFKTLDLYNADTRFHHGRTTSYDVGFRTVSVYGPTLVDNGTSYVNKTVYEHYGDVLTSAGGASTNIEDYLYHGKIKSIKQYDVSNKLFEEKLFSYGYTLAFKNGYTRPNLMKENIIWDQENDNPGGQYEYRDYYLNELISVNYQNVAISGPSAYQYLNIPVFTGTGDSKETPRFLDFYFYTALATTNQEYFLNSYFVKKTEEITRTYDDYLSKQAILSATVLPVVVTTNPNPFGGGLVNSVNYLRSRDSAYISQINVGTPKNVVTSLLAGSPLADTVLFKLIESTRFTSAEKTQILTAQTGLSNKIWKQAITHYNKFVALDLVNLTNTQSYFADEILTHAIANMNSRWDQKLIEAFLMHDEYLSFPVLQALMSTSSYISPGSITNVLAKQPQMPESILSSIISSSVVPKTSLSRVFKYQVMTESLYNQLNSNATVSNTAIVEIIENGFSYPNEATLLNIINRSTPFSVADMTRICAVANRQLEPSVITLLTSKYVNQPFLTQLQFSGNPLTQYCNGATSAGWNYIENKIAYEYYEADYRGVSNGRAYKVLMGLEDIPNRTVNMTAIFGSGGTKTIANLALKHEPSWQVFSVTSTSVHLPTAKNEEQYFYLFDLKNRYDRYWYNYDIKDLGADLTSFVPTIIDNTNRKDDTLAYTAKWHTQYSDAYEADAPEIPKYDGMTKSRQYNMRTTPYQKTTITKSQRDETAMMRSEYYFYDARWNFEINPIVNRPYSEDVYCPETGSPTPSPADCEQCMYWKYGFESDFLNALPNNYCLWEDDVIGYYACPFGVNAATCFPGAELVNCNPSLAEEQLPDPQRYLQIGDALSKTLQLRSTVVQLDTIMGALNTEFATKRFDRSNKYVVDFYLDPNGTDPNGFDGIYRMFYPFDTLTTMTIVERNEYFQPAIVKNQNSIRTRYYYKKAQQYWNDNTACDNPAYSFLYNYSSVDAQNIGLPIRVTVGWSRADSLSTTFEFTNDGQVKKTTNPSGHFFDYTFDGFNRLTSVTENGTRLLSTNEYSQWNHDGSLSFNDRTNQNYVYSILYNDGTNKEYKKSFLDPLSREAGILRAYGANANTKIYSGSVTYDSWGRAVESRKPFVTQDAGLIYRNSPVNSLKEIAKYDHNPASLKVRNANFNVAITSDQTVETVTHIVNNIVASCELGLNNTELQLIMKSGSTSAFRFKRTSVKDQDENETITYTNAFGKQVATIGWSNLNEKIVTLFVYDNYGNLTKTINPSRQHTDYKYNILGQLVTETTVDGGTKRFMYNKMGQISAIQDQLDRDFKNGSNISTPRYRKFTYDDYGKPTGQYWVTTTYHQDAFCYANSSIGQVGNYYVDPQGQSHYFRYTFSNRSSLDWLNTYSTLNPSLVIITTGGLPTGTSIAEKTTVYGTNNAFPLTIGKIVETKSYNLSGVAVQKITFSYDALGHIASQLIRQHPTNEALNDPKTVLAKIDYPSYNYRGSLLEERIDIGNDNSVEMDYFYEYDDLNRLRKVYAAQNSVSNSSAATLMATYTYSDVLGTVALAKLTVNNATTGTINAQDINYYYDMRDRLTSINSQLLDYTLYHDDNFPLTVIPDVTNILTVAHDDCYNGNVNGTKASYKFNASTAINTVPMFSYSTDYGYKYDGLNRLTNADGTVGDYVSAHYGNPSNTTQSDSYRIGDETIAYDKIGNITTLLRVKPGAQTNLGITYDDFVYQYGSGNRLTFVDGINGSADRTYTYDANGNMLTDNFRSISSTTYGRSSYAYNITKGTDAISYLYDGDDSRFYKKVVATAQTTEEMYIKDALGRDLAIVKFTTTNGVTPPPTKEFFVFGNERIARIVSDGLGSSPERIYPKEATFFLYDHLGNTRVSFENVGTDNLSKVVNALDYYPYGKILREYDFGDGDRYLTTNHERDRETGLDYRGARYYDSDVARFLSLDPLSSKFPSMSSYCYVSGNPITLVDPDGMAPKPVHTVYVYNVWLDKEGNKQKKLSHSYKTTEKYADVRVYRYFNNTGDKVDEKTQVIKGTENPVVLNTGSAYPIDPDPGPLTFVPEGNDDAGNTGGKLGGQKGWDNGGKQWFLGTITIVGGIVTLPAAGAYGITTTSISMVSAVDDIGGTYVSRRENGQFQSLTQSFFESEEAKDNVGVTKAVLGLFSLGSGVATSSKSLSDPLTLQTIGGIVTIIPDAAQAKENVQTIYKWW
jgi:RHS repeat-associated protein